MKKQYVRPFMIIGCLIALTCAALAYTTRQKMPGAEPVTNPGTGVVSLSGQLTQDKIFSRGDGIVSLSLSLKAGDVLDIENGEARNADMVIVMDRSSSMQGDKIRDAREAVLNLLSSLSDKDRFALVSYSDNVLRHSELINVTSANRENLESLVRGISASGATNLGAGLQEGISLLLSAAGTGNSGKVILISDGLANRGITDISALGRMASLAPEKFFTITTVGAGTDFNEQLMTAIADRGTGSYYYLEAPAAFAAVFKKEFHDTRAVAASAVTVTVPLSDGISLTDASGYPVEIRDNQAVFHPGDLLSGQTRKLFLTLKLPVEAERTFEIRGIRVSYRYEGEIFQTMLSEPFRIACVKDPDAALASVDKTEWEQKVLQEDYNRLREDVAADIRTGDEKKALGKIEKYRKQQAAVNTVLKSDKVAENLDKGMETLRDMVEHTFSGTREEVVQKKKENAKSLQFEGYKGRKTK
ncbi:VWA domain-containing protein [Desulfococcaceae bacterium HSG8]|nr:VWA domain-containing protein [Desulfococcaceae bacterium HSG8]